MYPNMGTKLLGKGWETYLFKALWEIYVQLLDNK